MKKFFQSQLGASLVQVLFIGSLLSGLALVGTQIVGDMKLTSKGAETRDDLETLHQIVSASMQDQVNCTETFNTCLAQNRVCLKSPHGVGAGETVIQVGGRYVQNKIGVSKIAMNVASGSMDITYTRLTAPNSTKSIGFGGKDITKTIPMKYVYEGSVFKRCYMDQNGNTTKTAQEFCTEMGDFMIWDAVKGCQLREHVCWNKPGFPAQYPEGSTFIGIDSLGKPICKKLSEWTDVSTIFHDGSTATCANRASVRLVVDSGKIKIECTSGAPTPPPCVPVDGTWTVGSWGTCTSGTQTRTVTCTGANSCGTCPPPQPATSQACASCTNVTRCSMWQFKYFQDYCGRKWTSSSTAPVKGYNFNGYYRPDSASAPNGYYDSGYNCSSTVVECVPASEVSYYWSTMSYSWPLKSRCVQNGDCPATCSCAATGCATTEAPGGW